MDVRTVLPMALSIILLIGGCSPERKIRAKAQWLCEEGQLKPELDYLSEDVDLRDYIRAEDVAYLEEHQEGEQDAVSDAGGFAALGKMMEASMRPGLRAMREAANSFRECEVTAVELGDESATAKLTVRERKPDGGLEIIGRVTDLAELDTHAERVKKAKGWYAEWPEETHEPELAFVKTDRGWVADMQLREKAEAERRKAEAEEKAKALEEEAIDLMEAHKYHEAKAKAEEALALMPESEGLKEGVRTLDEVIGSLVGGAWERSSETDAMTDDKNVVLVLWADEPVGDGYLAEYPSLMLRCRRGELGVYLNTTKFVDSNWRTKRTRVRTRFGKREPSTRRLDTSTSREAVFFPDEFAAELAEHDGERFVVEFPTSRSSYVAKFTLKGAAEAVRMVSECGGG